MDKNDVRKSVRAAELISRYLKGTITSEELAELENWVGSTEESISFMKEMTDAGLLQQEIQEFGKVHANERWERLLDKAIVREERNIKRAGRAIWMSVAAVLLVSIAAWQLVAMTGVLENLTVGPKAVVEDTLKPGWRQAELIVRSGKVMKLGSGDKNVIPGLLAGETKIQDTGLTNELRVPRAGEYQVELPDGTLVWVNAGSSLFFPSSFSEKERRVQLIGEAFFKVAKDKNRPFIVTTGKMSVEALGTAFNVRNYGGADSVITTTLTEGAIRVRYNAQEITVKPGQEITGDAKSISLTDIDTAVNSSWYKGSFYFNNTPLEEVMHQLERWYDVDIQYNSGYRKKARFTGEASRHLAAGSLLKMIELTGIASFSIRGKTITVLPYDR